MVYERGIVKGNAGIGLTGDCGYDTINLTVDVKD